jgi:hypothetical protein
LQIHDFGTGLPGGMLEDSGYLEGEEASVTVVRNRENAN